MEIIYYLRENPGVQRQQRMLCSQYIEGGESPMTAEILLPILLRLALVGIGILIFIVTYLGLHYFAQTGRSIGKFLSNSTVKILLSWVFAVFCVLVIAKLMEPLLP